MNSSPEKSSENILFFARETVGGEILLEKHVDLIYGHSVSDNFHTALDWLNLESRKVGWLESYTKNNMSLHNFTKKIGFDLLVILPAISFSFYSLVSLLFVAFTA